MTTRDEHRAKAEQILDDLATTTMNNPTKINVPYTQIMLGAAHVHALLAMSAPVLEEPAPEPKWEKNVVALPVPVFLETENEEMDRIASCQAGHKFGVTCEDVSDHERCLPCRERLARETAPECDHRGVGVRFQATGRDTAEYQCNRCNVNVKWSPFKNHWVTK